MIITIKKNAIKGIYISGDLIKSNIPGGLIFSSMIFSNPLPIEQTKKSWGIVPKKVAQKKLFAFTLKIQGKIFDIAKGIPPINLYANR